MILAEKIIMLRKQNGWSQEDLAIKMNVSRQSVSKWESAASIPDLNKILKLSELFGVSTDYLLKDDKEQVEEVYDVDMDCVAKVTMEEANTYLDLVSKCAPKIASGVFLCITSPILLVILSGFSEYEIGSISQQSSVGIGVAVLLIMVAVSVMLFIGTGMKLDKYEYLETEILSVDYGVESLAGKKKVDFEPIYIKCIVIGVVLCILSVIPIIIAKEELDQIFGVGILLFMVACGAFLIVWAGTIQNSYQKLLQQGDYTPKKKEENKRNQHIVRIYWCTITAVYLGISFIKNNWEISWVIWPCAGVFFVAFIAIATMIRKQK